jgi:Haloacid dehalogenase-like hydrolase
MIENPAKVVFREIVSNAGQRPLVVFDLDSTLFDVSPRTQQILNEFLNNQQIQAKFAQEIEHLKGLKVLSGDWGIKQAIIRSGLKSSEGFYKALRDFWRRRFFSSDYLHIDRPYKGAIEYVQALSRSQIEIYYLTGRDEQNMKRGTLETLAFWGLPLADESTHLIMKPVKGSVEDEDFKELRLRDLSKKSSLIWFFENEPLIIDKVLKSSLNIRIVWIDTTHSGKANPPVGLPIILQDGWEF